jgi:hypothetical protein
MELEKVSFVVLRHLVLGNNGQACWINRTQANHMARHVLCSAMSNQPVLAGLFVLPMVTDDDPLPGFLPSINTTGNFTDRPDLVRTAWLFWPQASELRGDFNFVVRSGWGIFLVLGPPLAEADLTLTFFTSIV